MACEISFIGYTENEEGVEDPVIFPGIIHNVDNAEEVTIDKIVNSIAALSSIDSEEAISSKDKFISFINSLKYHSLSKAELNKHRFISNTSIGELQQMYPDLAKLYPIQNPLPTSGITMIRCNTFKANGVDYDGRALDKNGNEIFIIKGRNGAKAFFKYLLERETITTDAKSADKIKKVVSEDIYKQLIAIKEHLQVKSLEDVFMKYLHEKKSKSLDPFEDTTLGVVNARHTISVALSIITNIYNRDIIYTPLEQLICQQSAGYNKKTKGSQWVWDISKSRLYSILDTYFKISDTYTEQEFKDLPIEELNKLFYGPQGYFFNHPRLYKSKIQTSAGFIDIRFTFPYASLGAVYNFGYDETQKFFSPVLQQEDSKLDSDGRYKGFYVYKSVNEKMKPIYAISRNPITSESFSATFSTLRAALINIDHKVKYDPIIKNCLYNLHDPAQVNSENRVQDVQMVDVKKDSIIAVSNFMLSKDTVTPIKYKKFPQGIQNLFNMSVLKVTDFLQKAFNEQGNFINNLKTAEQLGLFIMESFYTLYPNYRTTLVNETDLFKQQELLPKFEEIANKIINSSVSIYMVEDTKYKDKTHSDEQSTPVVLRSLGETCTATDSGVVTVNSKNSKLSQLIGKPIVDAAEAISKEYGIEIIVEPEDSLKSLPELQGLDFMNNLTSIKGFVHNNKIYINQSRATQADLFHEMVHVFLGVLKAQDYNSYEMLINKYAMEDNSFRAKFRMNRMKYKGLADIDIREEVLADLLAEQWFNKKEISEKFDINKYNDLMTNLLNKVDRAKAHIDPDENGLGFVKRGFGDSETVNRMRLRRKITNYLKNRMDEGAIKETCI